MNNGVKNLMSMFEADNVSNEFLNVQMEQLRNADTRDNCLATLERMNVDVEEDYDPELTEEQTAMEELLDDMGMTMEAIEFAEECKGKNCGGGSDDEDLVTEGAKKVRDKVLSTAYDIGDGISDVLDKTPVGPAIDKVHSTVNPVSYDHKKSNRKDRDAMRKKKSNVWAKECGDSKMEAMLARIPEGSVAETANFFKNTSEGLTKANESAVNDVISKLDAIIGATNNLVPAQESSLDFDPGLDFGLESFDLLEDPVLI
jgi:hypothetical protein